MMNINFSVQMSPNPISWFSAVLCTLNMMMLFPYVFSRFPVPEVTTSTVDMHHLTDALKRLLLFLDKHHSNINVDGIYCMRIVEGQLGMIRERYTEGKLSHVHNTVIQTLDQLQRNVAETSRKALRYTFIRDRSYTQAFLRVVDSPFDIYHHPRQIEKDFVPRHEENPDNFNEELSDQCILELLGTKINAACTISDRCWRVMTLDNSMQYSATHQVLYLLVGEKTGCLDKIDELAAYTGHGNINKLYKKMCTRIHAEAQLLVKNREFPAGEDLFMEQIAICSLVGFHQFLKPAWLQLILSWQQESGCYGDDSSNDEHEERRDQMEQEIHNSPTDVLGPNLINPQNTKLNWDVKGRHQLDDGKIRRGVKPVLIGDTYNTGRRLLREAGMPGTDGCMSHMSGVAAASLVMFYHRFLDVNYYDVQNVANYVIGVDLAGMVIPARNYTKLSVFENELKFDRQNAEGTGTNNNMVWINRNMFQRGCVIVVINVTLLVVYFIRRWHGKITCKRCF